MSKIGNVGIGIIGDPAFSVTIKYPSNPEKLAKVLDTLWNGGIASFSLTQKQIDKLRKITTVEIKDDQEDGVK